MDEQSKSQTSCRKPRYFGSTCPVSVLSLVLCVALFIRVEFLQHEVVLMRAGTTKQNGAQQHNVTKKDATVKLRVKRSESLVRSPRNVPTSTQTSAVTMEQVRAEINCNKSVKSIYIQGPRGIPGIPGAIGLPGQPGREGPRGQPGRDGRDGRRGRRGAKGIKGNRGNMGPPGPVGKHGSQGIRGPPGITGIKGDIGVPGIRGAAGIRGLPGPKGVQGMKGEPGESLVIPSVIVSPPNVTIREGVTVTFYCSASGALLPTVTWSRKSGNFSRRFLTDDIGKLQIQNARFRDMGEFTCTAINILGKTTKTVALLVNAQARFSSKPQPYHSVYVGMDTVMSCDVIGFPRPTVEWSRSLGQMPAGSHVTRDHSLVIKDTKKSDTVIYICKGKNNFGEVMKIIFLDVKIVVPPHITSRLDPVLTLQGIHLSCAATGSPVPRVEWLRDDQPFVGGREQTVIKGNRVTSNMTLDRVQPSDEGNYTCKFINEMNQTATATSTLINVNSPECRDYKSLTDADRRDSYVITNLKCDNGLTPGWYRFAGAAGTRMPDSCTNPAGSRCNTHGTSWLSGGHPTVADGKVTRRVCFSWSGSCCSNGKRIDVRNCGSFYVYKLRSTSACNYRYCGTS